MNLNALHYDFHVNRAAARRFRRKWLRRLTGPAIYAAFAAGFALVHWAIQ